MKYVVDIIIEPLVNLITKKNIKETLFNKL